MDVSVKGGGHQKGGKAENRGETCRRIAKRREKVSIREGEETKGRAREHSKKKVKIAKDPTYVLTQEHFCGRTGKEYGWEGRERDSAEGKKSTQKKLRVQEKQRLKRRRKLNSVNASPRKAGGVA